MITDSLSAPLQLQLLTLLCFSPTASSLIRGAIEPRMFSSTVQRRIVDRVYAYLDEFHRPPQDHLSDLIEDIIDNGGQSEEKSSPEMYADVMESLLTLRKKVDEDFVLSQLESFVRQQALRTGIVRASEAVQSGDLAGAEAAMHTAMRTQLKVFTPGLTLSEGLARINEETRTDLLPLAIKPLDDNQLGPARGELWLFMAPPKRGKSWMLTHIGKQGLLHRLSVLHITLEISERLVVQRYIQSLFSVQRIKARVNVIRLKTDDIGRVYQLERETLRERLSFKDSGIKALLTTKLGKFHARERLLVKAFPTGVLTISALRNYLDLLERTGNFTPDVLIVDYPDLMKISSDNYRLEIGTVFRDLRGIAVERNLMCAVATQSNRSGATAKVVTDAHTSEDYSKIATADTVLTYSQTLAEKELGLARIFVSNTRVGEQDRFIVLVTQAYRIGQFCLDSTALPSTYDSHLQALLGKNPDEDPSEKTD